MAYEIKTIKGLDIAVDTFFRQKLDNVKTLLKKKWDCVFLIDGIEGCGKSTLSFICAWYIADGEITMRNICEGTEDAVEKLQNLPNGSVLIIDEGSLMFSSKEVMRKEQRRLEKILQVIRQKCMCLIIVSPSFFNLNKYISVERSRFLLHVYTDPNLNRGRFCYFSQKKKRRLYSAGKKNFNSYEKPRSDFVSRFVKFELPFNEEYLRLKQRSLMESFEIEKPAKQMQTIRKEILAPPISLISDNLPITTQKQLVKVLNISHRTLLNWKMAASEMLKSKSEAQLCYNP